MSTKNIEAAAKHLHEAREAVCKSAAVLAVESLDGKTLEALSNLFGACDRRLTGCILRSRPPVTQDGRDAPPRLTRYR